MSGGRFEYKQFEISNIADGVHQEIAKSGKPKSPEQLKYESWRDKEWYEKYPEDLNHYQYSDEVIEEFKKGYWILRKAAIYAQRIDWLLSGDDGDESFIRRLNDELERLDERMLTEKFDYFRDEDYE
jgi:hypothetical protein